MRRQAEIKLMEEHNTDGIWKEAEELVEFIWFLLCFHLARGGREE